MGIGFSIAKRRKEKVVPNNEKCSNLLFNKLGVIPYATARQVVVRVWQFYQNQGIRKKFCSHIINIPRMIF